ncbi:MAG: carbohydrate porin [Chlamydiia bacterium]
MQYRLFSVLSCLISLTAMAEEVEAEATATLPTAIPAEEGKKEGTTPPAVVAAEKEWESWAKRIRKNLGPEDSAVGFGETGLGISSNPAAVNIFTGTGKLGSLFGARPSTGVRLGGMYIADGNAVLAGGISHQVTGNSLLVLSLSMDFEKMSYWKGGLFGMEFLQFNGMPTDTYAGVFPSYNSLPGQPPLDRSELYQLWYRQSLLDDRLIFRIGKTVPTYDFNNVLRPVPTRDESLSIPSVSGLIYTPIFVNPTMLGVMPGYYNSAYGLTINAAPWEDYYFSYGVYDGNLANGVQTGLTGPHFNGYYFQVAEAGMAWGIGPWHKPGMSAVGGWYQTGCLSAVCKAPPVCCDEEPECPPCPDCPPACPSCEPEPVCKIQEQGTGGIYIFGSQRLWLRHPEVDNSGVSAFYQAGVNFSQTLPFQEYLGLGATAYGLTRPNDSMGIGMAWSWMNKHTFNRPSQLMFQAYYQGNISSTVYLQPVISYIPTPSLGADIPQTWAVTLRLIALF